MAPGLSTDERVRSSTIRAVGRRMCELREARGLSQENLADRLGCTAKVYARWERGELDLRVWTLVRIARALDAHPAAFFEPPSTSRKKPGRPRRKV